LIQYLSEVSIQRDWHENLSRKKAGKDQPYYLYHVDDLHLTTATTTRKVIRLVSIGGAVSSTKVFLWITLPIANSIDTYKKNATSNFT
jgi:hypothetical protein